MFKLALSAGHGRYTSGKRCSKSIDPNETREWVLNDRIADKIEKLLANYNDIEILRVDDTTGEKDVLLRNRSSASNKWGADFYLAIHHNAGINGGSGGGIVVYVYTTAMAESIAWQKDLYKSLIDATGLKGNRSSPMLKANLHECREPDCAAVLLELGFMDSTTDVPIILTEDYANKCAQACVDVIVKRAKLSKKVNNIPSPAPQTKVYRVRKTWADSASQLGAFKFLDNAKAACKPGYSVFDENGTAIYTVKVQETFNNLKRGSAGTNVKKLQNLLNLLGYNCGNPDGNFGAQTEAALKSFQQANRITVDGIFGATSFSYLKKALNSANFNLKQGSSGFRVKALQNILNDYGCNCGTADGIFGAKTKTAAQAYQKKKGLTQDGIVGPKTIASFVDYLKL